MQLEFICPECGLSGLTPEIEEGKAVAVALNQLRIRCPACSAIVEVTEPTGMASVSLAMSGPSLSLLIRNALEAMIVRRAAKKNKKRGQQSAAPLPRDPQTGHSDGER